MPRGGRRESLLLEFRASVKEDMYSESVVSELKEVEGRREERGRRRDEWVLRVWIMSERDCSFGTG